MRVLLDSCVGSGIAVVLQGAGHDVLRVSDFGPDTGDVRVLALAREQDRVLITLDKDLGELAIVRRLPHCGIVRLVNSSTAKQGSACLHVLEAYEHALIEGSIITVEPDRIRIRTPE